MHKILRLQIQLIRVAPNYKMCLLKNWRRCVMFQLCEYSLSWAKTFHFLIKIICQISNFKVSCIERDIENNNFDLEINSGSFSEHDMEIGSFSDATINEEMIAKGKLAHESVLNWFNLWSLSLDLSTWLCYLYANDNKHLIYIVEIESAHKFSKH